MNILAFDTSFGACSIALLANNDLTVRHDVAPMQQAKLVLPGIHALLESAQLSITDLDAIAYGCGPASFTGIRLAASVAQALGFAHRIPLISISSLAGLAQSVYMSHGYTHMLVAVDARMNQLYVAEYRVSPESIVENSSDEVLVTIDELSIPESGLCALVGNAWNKYQHELSSIIHDQSLPVVTTEDIMASAMIPLAKNSLQSRKWVAPENALPVYLR